jgi:hypothetical protein
MAAEFWGRQREMARLRSELDQARSSGQGRMLTVRGRRQTGKSRLLTELVETSGVPYLFTTAIKNAAAPVQLNQVASDLHAARVPLPELDAAFAVPPASWSDLFARLPLAIGDGAAIVVLDEFPWATQTDLTLEGVLQSAWDRTLERLPVLLVLVGSDMSMMERLTEHDRPLYGRSNEMVVSALSPAEVAEAFHDGRPAIDLLDVFLATGGYPRLALAAREHRSARQFVISQLQDDQSPLSVTGLRMLDAEFRDDLRARTVLDAIGAVEVGHATFSTAVAKLGGDEKAAGAALTRARSALVEDKRVVAIDTPIGAKPASKLRRYRIVDPYLRFWFRYCAPHLDDIARGRPDLAVDHFDRDFASWRGMTIEPVVRDALLRLSRSDQRLGAPVTVGAWWDRTNAHEYDIVGAQRSGSIAMVGTIKWRPRKPVSADELRTLASARAVVPNAATAKLVAVCPAGVHAGTEPDALLDADDILGAFR